MRTARCMVFLAAMAMCFVLSSAWWGDDDDDDEYRDRLWDTRFDHQPVMDVSLTWQPGDDSPCTPVHQTCQDCCAEAGQGYKHENGGCFCDAGNDKWVRNVISRDDSYLFSR